MKTLNEKLQYLESINGKADGVILIGEAFHSCRPDIEHGWECHAISINADGSFDIGSVYWDFSEYVKEIGYDPSDAGDYPWDGDCEFSASCTGLTLEDDKAELVSWIGDFI